MVSELLQHVEDVSLSGSASYSSANNSHVATFESVPDENGNLTTVVARGSAPDTSNNTQVSGVMVCEGRYAASMSFTVSV